MSVESIETGHNDYWKQSGSWETDAKMFDIEENFNDSKFVSDVKNLPVAKLARETQLNILDDEIEEQHQLDIHYHTVKQKMEMEMRQMELELGISLERYKDMPRALRLTIKSPSFQLAQTSRRNANSEKVNGFGRDQIFDNSSSAGLDYEDERSTGKFTIFPDTPDLGPMNEQQSDEGDVLTSMSEEVVRDLFELCYPYDIRNEHEDSDWVYWDMAQHLEYPNLSWGDRALEHQKFKAELFKTEMCRSWAKFGLCPYGENCRFAHGHTELRVRPKPHWKYKTELCKKFLAGYCPYGSRCSFVHMPSEWHGATRGIQRSVRPTVDLSQTRERYDRERHRNPTPIDSERAFDRMLRLNE